MGAGLPIVLPFEKHCRWEKVGASLPSLTRPALPHAATILL